MGVHGWQLYQYTMKKTFLCKLFSKYKFKRNKLEKLIIHFVSMFMFIHHTACKKLKEIKIEIDSFIVLIYSTTTVQQYKI